MMISRLDLISLLVMLLTMPTSVATVAEVTPPIWLRVASTNVDPVVTKATGDYLVFGTMANGSPLYRLDSDMFDQFLYRSRKGFWAFSPSHINAVKNRGTISSIENVSSLPMGLTFGYHLATTDIDDRPHNDQGILLSYCSRRAASIAGTKCHNTFNVTDVSLTRGAAETRAESLRANDKSRSIVQDNGACDSKDIGSRASIASPFDDLRDETTDLPEVPLADINRKSESSNGGTAALESRQSKVAEELKLPKADLTTAIAARNIIQSELDDAGRENENLKAERSTVGREKATIEAEFPIADREKDVIEKPLPSANHEKDTILSSLTDADSAMETLLSRLADADSEKDNLKAALANADKERETLQSNLADADREKETLLSSLADADSEKENLKAALAIADREKETLQANLVDAGHEKDTLQSNLANAGREKETLLSSLADADSEKDSLKAALANADKERETLQSSLADAGHEKDTLQSNLADADREKKSMKTKLADAGREKDTLLAKLATADHDTESLRAEITLADRTKASDHEKEFLRAELANANREKDSFKAEVIAAVRDKEILQAELDSVGTIQAKLAAADRKNPKLHAELATADREPSNSNSQQHWQIITVGLAVTIVILIFALVKKGSPQNDNASNSECARCDILQKDAKNAAKELDALTAQNTKTSEALQKCNEKAEVADLKAEELRSMLESIKIELSLNYDLTSAADDREKQLEAALADHVKMLESLRANQIQYQDDSDDPDRSSKSELAATKDLLREAREKLQQVVQDAKVAQSLAEEKAQVEAAERQLSEQKAKIVVENLESDLARLQNDHDLLRATAQERRAEVECLAMANAKAGQDLVSAREECRDAQTRVQEKHTKLDAVREAITQENDAADLRSAEARENLNASKEVASKLMSQVDQARLAQQQAAESAQAKLDEMQKELASANSLAETAQAELDGLREAQRKAKEEAEKKLRSAFGEVSDMKEKCAYFMQALKNEKQAGTDLRISAVKKVREALNISKERVRELEAKLHQSNSGGEVVSKPAEE